MATDERPAAPLLRPGSPPIFDAAGNLWLPAYDENHGPHCIDRDRLSWFATGGAGDSPEDLGEIGRILASLLGVRPIPTAGAVVQKIAGPAGTPATQLEALADGVDRKPECT